MARDEDVQDLVELRPAPAVLLRHRDADLEVHTAPRTGPRVELRRGALWIRAGEEGPGVTVTHGATSVQVRAGAGVLEVVDMEALLVVASGRAAVKGVSPLPRSVIAGQAVTLTLDGTFSDPDALSAAELAADRMVVENLALDNLASTTPASASSPAPAPSTSPDPQPEAEPLPTRVPGATTTARVDPPGAPAVVGTDEPPAPPTEPEPEPVPEPAPVAEVPAPEPAPAPPPVGRPAPSLPEAGPSALEAALAGVGVTDTPPEPGEARVPVTLEAPAPGTTPAPPPKGRAEKRPGKAPAAATGEAPAEDERRRQRILVALVLGALLILAIVAALAFGADSASALGI